MTGSDILIYRLVYNLVENAIKYNHTWWTGYSDCRPAGKTGAPVHVLFRIRETAFPRSFGNREYLNLSSAWINPEVRALGGVGLGLALVREIVRVHEGSITVQDPILSGGTIFEVMFAQ